MKKKFHHRKCLLVSENMSLISLWLSMTISFFMAFLKCVNARETSWSLSLLFPLHTEQTESKMFSLQGSVPKMFLSFLLSLGFFIMDDLLLLCLTGILNEEIVTQISSQEGFYHWKQILLFFLWEISLLYNNNKFFDSFLKMYQW